MGRVANWFHERVPVNTDVLRELGEVLDAIAPTGEAVAQCHC